MPHKTNNKKTWTKVLFLIAMAVCILGFITSPIALVGGFLFTYFFGHPFLNLSGKAVSWLLKVAVVGLGFGMNLLETLDAGKTRSEEQRLNSSHVRISY